MSPFPIKCQCLSYTLLYPFSPTDNFYNSDNINVILDYPEFVDVTPLYPEQRKPFVCRIEILLGTIMYNY